MPNRLVEASEASDTANSGSVTVGVTDTAVLPINQGRTEFTLCNTDPTNFICVVFGTSAAVLNTGIYLAPKTCITTDSYLGAVRAIASVAPCNLSFAEIT